MNDLVEYRKVIDFEIIDGINYEILNMADYEELERQLEKEKEYIALEDKKAANNTLAIVSLIMGIISCITMLIGFCYPYVGILAAFFSGAESLSAIIMAILALKKGANKLMAIFGIICAVIGIILGVILFLFCFIVILFLFKEPA